MLTNAHQGYYYQDILSAYFLASEISVGKLDTIFRFDKKEMRGDQFDDLVIRRRNQISRYQIKYSNEHSNHHLCKSDLSNGNGYGIALSDLYLSWKNLKDRRGEYRLCLAWERPESNDSLTNILIECTDTMASIDGSKVYRIDIETFWPEGGQPLSGWRKFRKFLKTENRTDFAEFCQQLIIEVELPKASLKLIDPGPIELELFDKIKKIGVGIFPNDNLDERTVASYLIGLVRQKRMDESALSWECSAREAAVHARIKLDYGSIEQIFPVIESHLVSTKSSVKLILQALKKKDKILVTGEPGSGKSWMINNLEFALPNKTRIVKHYCYTSLDDDLQTSRVRVNTLYGSLINQLVRTFDDLSQFKPKRYAANLPELNNLIAEIPEPTIILVDGLDHIWRMYEKHRKELVKEEIGILEALQQINVDNPNVSLIVLSQPISQLDRLIEFQKVKVQDWRVDEVIALLNVMGIKDEKLDDKIHLSELILEKSGGNALYASYIVKWLSNQNYINIKTIKALPPYAFNLKPYYTYLLNQFDQDNQIPMAFCAVNFSLNENDLREITGLGNRVTRHIKILRPILNHNIAYAGFKIYHESFKRFMLEKLEEDEVDIKKVVYEPIGKWLSEKDFYNFRKASLYLLPLLYESDNLEKIAETIHPNFIHKSLYFGHPVSIIQANQIFQAKSLSITRDLTKIIMVSEQKKIIGELPDSDFTSSGYKQYLKAIKYIHGDQAMYDCIYNEGKLLLDLETVYQMLKEASYEEGNVDWNIIPNKKMMYLSEFDAIITQRLYNRNYEKIEKYANQFYKKNNKNKEWQSILIKEIKRWNKYIGTNRWMDDYPKIKQLVYPQKNKVSVTSILKNIKKLKNFKSSEFEANRGLINSIEKEVVLLVEEGKERALVEGLNSIVNDSWFLHWLQYMIWITIFRTSKHFNFNNLEQTFDLLITGLYVEVQKPRFIDYYHLYETFYTSFVNGLELCNNYEERCVCLNILRKFSDETTFSIQRDFSGPLKPEAFLDLQIKFQPPEFVIPIYEEEINFAKKNRTYDDLAFMNFRISAVYFESGNQAKAEESFKNGIQRLVGYGQRKDSTLGELLESCEDYIKVHPQDGIGTIEQLYRLSWSVVNHTDGKGTSRYPVDWFKKFYRIYPLRALSFLATEILSSNYPHHLDESCLEYVLFYSRGEIHPLLSFLLLKIIPNNVNEDFYWSAIYTYQAGNKKDKSIMLDWLKKISRNAHLRRYSNGYPNDLVKSYKKVLSSKFTNNFKVDKPYTANENDPKKIKFEAKSIEDALSKIDSGRFDDFEIASIKKYLSSIEASEKRKVYVLEILKNDYSSGNKLPWLDDFYKEGTEDWFFTQVACFIYRSDGWHSPMDDPSPFVKAYLLSPETSLKYLFEILTKLLSGKYSYQQLSANLLKALIACKINPEEIDEVWKTMFNIINARIPDQYESDFSQEIDSFLYKLSEQELLVCILLSRIKGMTTERVQNAVHGIYIIANEEPNLLIQPLQWLLSNSDKLTPFHLAIILQVINETPVLKELSPALKKIIEDLYPSNYYWTDYLIEQILDKRPRRKIIEESFIIGSSTQRDIDKLKGQHFRYWFFADQGIDLSMIITEGNIRMQEEQKLWDHYSNRIVRNSVLTTKKSEIDYKLFHSKFYNQLRSIESFNEELILRILPFQIDKITAQIGSKIARPVSLDLPSSILKEYNIVKPKISKGWLRIASNEFEYVGESFKVNSLRNCSQSIIFGTIENQDSLFSKYRLIFELYENNSYKPGLEKQPVIYDQIFDFFERINILWLAPDVCQKLGIKIRHPLYQGLVGVNQKEEEVLRFHSWSEGYTGGNSGSDEFPKISGGELIIRKDYFKMMEALYSQKGKIYMRNSILN